jgi:hypothetical protein
MRNGWRTITLGLLAWASLLVGVATYAQQPEPSAGCTHTFTKGLGAAQISYCVNAHGNLLRFSTAGAEHKGGGVDGYSVCSSTFGVHGYDTGAGSETAWGANALISGPSSTGVAYARTTADGVLRVEHTFKMDSAEGDIEVTVKMINLTPSAIDGVQYRRTADFNGVGSNLWTRSLDEVEALSTVTLRGASLNAISFTTAHDTSIADHLGFLHCELPESQPSGSSLSAWAHVLYNLGTINASKSKTVKFRYKRK